MSNRSTAAPRLFPLLLALLLAGGCSIARPGPPAAPSADHTWIRQPNLFNRFDTTGRTFNPVNAYLLALAVRAGDMNTAEQRQTVRGWGFTDYTPIIDREASVYAYVASSDRMVLAVFSGTDIRNIRDLESDADALYPVERDRYADVEGALLHRGFASNMDAIWESITRETVRHASRQSGPPKPVFIAGHSRGGAFATLAATGWAQDGTVPVAGLYTYGQPRVGNAEYARHAASLGFPYFRIINERDAVAGIPIQIGSLGTDYAHAGVVAHLTAGPSLRKDPPPADLRLFVIDPDHYMDGYIAKLYQVITQPQRIENESWRAMAVGAAAATTTAPATTQATTAPSLPRPPFL